ncbi:MAG: hypothetical protein NXI32_16315, partial [bacterium]|nr:hypothetical protein [bacterium]
WPDSFLTECFSWVGEESGLFSYLHKCENPNFPSEKMLHSVAFQGFTACDWLRSQGDALRLRRDALPWADMSLAFQAEVGHPNTSTARRRYAGFVSSGFPENIITTRERMSDRVS